MNHQLARALRGAGTDTIDVAARLGVDPKTVNRWLAGRLPYPRHRAALTQLTGWTERDLWPQLTHPALPESATHEIRIAYPHRSAVPGDAWRRLFARAQHDIGIAAYSALFLAEDADIKQVLQQKARAGVRVRIILGDPTGKHIHQRGTEEGIGTVMAARIHNTLILCQPLTDLPGIELRTHDTVLYNSIYLADDEMLVNTHTYACPASHAPVLHLRQTREDGMVATYRDSFERIWATAHPTGAT